MAKTFWVYLKTKEHPVKIEAQSGKSDGNYLLLQNGNEEVGRFLIHELQGWRNEDTTEK
jgi:hypothetical protein